jgi:hypothetical protein
VVLTSPGRDDLAGSGFALQEKVENWLGTLRCQPKVQDDPNSSWHLVFEYPASSSHVMNAVRPKGENTPVVVVTRTNVDEVHRRKFAELDDEAKEDFLWQLRRTMKSVDVDFQVEGAEGPLGCPTAFQLSIARFEDGLTLDSFAQSVGKVFKTELNAVWVLQEHFKPDNGGRGPRFDFKKFGV